MRLRELLDKELISIDEGRRYGSMQQMDVLFHPETGQIEALELNRRSFFSFFRWPKGETWHIPWHSIRKIGPDLILFETSSSKEIRTENPLPNGEDVETMHRPTET